ncbi:hypothetical protein L3X38_004574 [Prunus dulcis]|uniref:Uncharacterized protein n=1 Tax=Prunus dulcis TaxID=3755 RepID=A0AAD4ZP53_PRUDU|nr:hypothetical protein L3X38_004574 [Prunus dulcis]
MIEIVAFASLSPHGRAARSEANHHDEAAVHDAATTRGHLGAASNYNPILEQLHMFPPLPLRLMIAPYTSNETLARVQLGSTQFSHLDPSNQVDQLTQIVDDQNNLIG